ncbi:MAG: GtrA family protein [Cyanobacteriota bacterium]|nr:GtrA family protein [Cyanobacteriota bacterium]
MKPSRRLSAQFLRFVIANTLAAAANISIKLTSGFIVGDPLSILLGFTGGLTTSYLLCRQFVFDPGGRIKAAEIARFSAVNLAGLAITFLVYHHSYVALQKLIPPPQEATLLKTLAHTIGVVAPMVFSFFAQKTLTFRQHIY